MLYQIKVDGKPAYIDREMDELVVPGAPIPRAERFIAYAAACTQVAYELVGMAGDVGGVGDMGDAFYERNYEDIAARWLDYAEDCHKEWSVKERTWMGNDRVLNTTIIDDADLVPALTREECEERIEAMRERMSDFLIAS